jgi:UDP:flavonoid glycosyltransferase YjiC (YdhE family)
LHAPDQHSQSEPGTGARRSRRRLRVYLGAFGQPGHAFPMLALGRGLAERGHLVAYETWTRWREHVREAGMTFHAAPEYPAFPTQEQPLGPYEAVVAAAAQTEPRIREFAPDVVVHDVLTLAPALAAERLGLSTATLVPHVNPVGAPGLPPYGLGARCPSTAVGRWLWRALDPLVERGLRQGRRELNDARAKLGLPPTDLLHGGLSRRLCLIGSFPQLEYPRRWPAWAHVVGPLMWEPPHGEVAPPAGEGPLVLIAPSTAQDPDQRLIAAALEGLAQEPLRVLASTNGRPLPRALHVPPNAVLVDWVSYSRTMPLADLVVCHAGFGTLARALALGRPVLAVPHVGDMGENAARLAWSGAGLRLPWRLLSPGALRLAVRRALGEPSLAARAAEIAAWSAAHHAPTRAAELIEALAGAQQHSDRRART